VCTALDAVIVVINRLKFAEESKQSLQILRSFKQPHLSTNRCYGDSMLVSRPRRSRYRPKALHPFQAAMPRAFGCQHQSHDIRMSRFSCQRPWLLGAILAREFEIKNINDLTAYETRTARANGRTNRERDGATQSRLKEHVRTKMMPGRPTRRSIHARLGSTDIICGSPANRDDGCVL
jgi:hypothetical protein